MTPGFHSPLELVFRGGGRCPGLLPPCKTKFPVYPASPYEYKIANVYAGAFRVDNTSVKGLRLSLAGYVGNSFRNTMAPTSSEKNAGIHGTVTIGTFDFRY